MAYLLIFLMSVLGLMNAVHTYSECSMTRTSSLRFSVKSTVNDLGERAVLVEGLGEAQRADALGVSVEHWTALCHNLQVVGLQLNVTGPIIESPAVEVGITTSSELPTTKSPGSCSFGYILVADVGCYKKSNTKLAWEEARRFCEAEGAHLATPDTQIELNAIEMIRTSMGNSPYPWIGVHKSGGSWQTVQGRSGFLNWVTGRPNGTGDCADLRHGHIQDVNCSVRDYFICEKPMV